MTALFPKRPLPIMHPILQRALNGPAFVLGLVFFIFGCSGGEKTKTEMLTKKWEIEEWDLSALKNAGPGSGQMKAEMDRMKEHAYFHFKKSGEFEVQMMGKNKGEWELIDNQRLIMTRADQSQKDTTRIQSLSPDKLVLERKFPMGGTLTVTLVPEKP